MVADPDSVASELTPLRFGTLGAATITPMALLNPAKKLNEVSVVGIAARDPEKARRFAEHRTIPRVFDSYEALIEDPEIDAIYNPLPNSLHCEWTIRALEAGKHVLCEKPFSANSDEALRMAEAATRADRILMEAFHWRYHPLAHRAKSILESGELGAVQHLEARLCVPMLAPRNIRYRLDLAGGATMDVGAYTVNMIRYFADAEPEVRAAEARLSSPPGGPLDAGGSRFRRWAYGANYAFPPLDFATRNLRSHPLRGGDPRHFQPSRPAHLSSYEDPQQRSRTTRTASARRRHLRAPASSVHCSRAG